MMYNQKLVTSVKCKGKVMRERGDTVFLPFGEEYSLLLKNLSSQKAQIKVEIDGETVISALLLKPNQSIDLERYVIDDNLSKGPKFKFIEKTNQISNHRGDRVDDGIVRITYQFEELVQWCPPVVYTKDPWNDLYGKSIWYDGYPTTKLSDNSWECHDGAVYNTTSVGASLTRGVESDNGITTKGSESDQKFVHGNIGVLESTVHSIVLQLKGDIGGCEVTKPLTVSRKIKCEVCGNINKSSSSFCGNCGTNLTYQY